MAAFNSVFNKCFKEELSQYGFRKLKGLDAVGRVVGKELMQYIILYPRSSLVRGRKTFTAVFGICTVYSFSSADIWKYDLINRGVRLIEVAPKGNRKKKAAIRIQLSFNGCCMNIFMTRKIRTAWPPLRQNVPDA